MADKAKQFLLLSVRMCFLQFRIIFTSKMPLLSCKDKQIKWKEPSIYFTKIGRIEIKIQNIAEFIQP